MKNLNQIDMSGVVLIHKHLRQIKPRWGYYIRQIDSIGGAIYLLTLEDNKLQLFREVYIGRVKNFTRKILAWNLKDLYRLHKREYPNE